MNKEKATKRYVIDQERLDGLDELVQTMKNILTDIIAKCDRQENLNSKKAPH